MSSASSSPSGASPRGAPRASDGTTGGPPAPSSGGIRQTLSESRAALRALLTTGGATASTAVGSAGVDSISGSPPSAGPGALGGEFGWLLYLSDVVSGGVCG